MPEHKSPRQVLASHLAALVEKFDRHRAVYLIDLVTVEGRRAEPVRPLCDYLKEARY